MKEYFIGTDDLLRADQIDAAQTGAMISANTLVNRKADIKVDRWMMDSGAFTQVTKYGDFIMSPKEYIAIAKRHEATGRLACIVSQDYMCEPDVIEMLKKAGNEASVRIHQRKSVERYIELCEEATKQGLNTPIMPVLQGWEVEDYAEHYKMYQKMIPAAQTTNPILNQAIHNKDLTIGKGGWQLADRAVIKNELFNPFTQGFNHSGKWIGIGSTCKRNLNPEIVSEILDSLEEYTAGMKIHLFGYKTTGLKSDRIKDRIHSADSFAYDFDDRYTTTERTRENRIAAAKNFGEKIVHNAVQTSFDLAA